jgi:hypothetical protein
MMMSMRERHPRAALAAATVGTALLILALAAVPASAEVSNVGKNLGSEVSSWAKALVFPLAALGGLGAYFKRDVGMAFQLLAITMIVGAFAYNPGNVVENLIGSLWSALVS